MMIINHLSCLEKIRNNFKVYAIKFFEIMKDKDVGKHNSLIISTGKTISNNTLDNSLSSLLLSWSSSASPSSSPPPPLSSHYQN